MYGPNLTQDYAIEEWFSYYQPAPNEMRRDRVNGVVDCFCKAEFKKQLHKLGSAVYTDQEGNSATVCSEWFTDFLTVQGVNMGISIGINVVNVILKMILIKLVEKICEDTKSA